jgi:hypothetical protein
MQRATLLHRAWGGSKQRQGSTMRKVRKRFDLHAEDDLKLDWRINTLRRALRKRNGRIVDIRWSRSSDRLNARILYEIQLPQREGVPPRHSHLAALGAAGT